MKEKRQEPSIKRKKPILPIVLILVAALVLAALPRITQRKTVEENASIRSVEAAAATIETAIRAGGTLIDREAQSVSLPEDVELNFVVKNGDTVKAGDLIAVVDKESLMITIAALQDNLDAMDEKIDEAMDEDAVSQVEASASGRVKAIYAQEDALVTDIMHEHNALVVLSLDGLMALDIAWPDATVGAGVKVTLSDETVVSGKVDAIRGNTVTITLSDETAALNENVIVTDQEENVIGSGNLYIHQPLNVTGYYGQVEDVVVEVGEKLDAGDTLMTLTGVDSTAGYAGLLSQRQRMEKQMTTLFTLYQAGGVYAESDGIIAELSDEDNLEGVMAAQASYQLTQMVNSPDGMENYTNYAATVTGIDGVNLSMTLCPVTISNLDYADTKLLESLPYTQITGYTLAENTQVYVLENAVWTLKDLSEIRVGDKLILAFSDVTATEPVWIVCHHEQQKEPEGETSATPPTMPADPEENLPDEENGALNEPEKPGENEQPSTTPTNPGDESQNSEVNPPTGNNDKPQVSVSQQMPQIDGNTGGFGSGNMGSFNADGIPTTKPAAADLILTETVVYTLTPDTDMTVDLLIDEMDLANIKMGQEVRLVLAALPERELTAVVTAIAESSDSESGSAKYAVEITVERFREMRSGMNASVTIPVAVTEAACAVPAAALVEKEGITQVYTSYDRETDTLGDPVAVTTGVSDGEMVEILTGLNAGDTVYYTYTEVIEYDFVQ